MVRMEERGNCGEWQSRESEVFPTTFPGSPTVQQACPRRHHITGPGLVTDTLQLAEDKGTNKNILLKGWKERRKQEKRRGQRGFQEKERNNRVRENYIFPSSPISP